MNREEILEIARIELSTIYAEFKSCGLLSVYLWGSVTTADFNPIKSDIDCIGIIESSANIHNQALINKFLEEGRLGSYSPKMNYLYKEELDGDTVKSDLAKVIDPRLLVSDLPYWTYIAGQEFSQKDFKISPVTPKAAVQILLAEISKRYLPLTGELKEYKYFLKAIARLCYYLEQGDEIKEPFSYAGLLKNKNELTEKAVDAFSNIKTHDWDADIFKHECEVFMELVHTLRSD